MLLFNIQSNSDFPVSLALASLDQKAEIYVVKAVCLHFSIRQYDDLCIAWIMCLKWVYVKFLLFGQAFLIES